MPKLVWKAFKQDMIAMLGEFVGTTMFLWLGLGCIKTAQDSQSAAQQQVATTLSQQTIMYISVGMGLSLLVTAWVFYRITGGLFNPAITLSLWLIGGLTAVRAILLTAAQIAGGIAGAALVLGVTPGPSAGVAGDGGVGNTITTLAPGISLPKGIFMEALLTAMLVFTVLMLAAEKHKATFMAPIGIGLVLFVCQLFGTLWTGCGMNPARALGPSVITGRFPGYHWIYWVGPLIGSLIATFIYTLLKAFHYSDVVMGQDSDSEAITAKGAPINRMWNATHGFTRDQRRNMLAAGMRADELERAEAGMVHQAMREQPAGSLISQPSRNSQSTLTPHGQSATHHTASKIEKTGQQPSGNNMGSNDQAGGGLGQPGSQGSGLTEIGWLRKAFHHGHHQGGAN